MAPKFIFAVVTGGLAFAITSTVSWVRSTPLSWFAASAIFLGLFIAVAVTIALCAIALSTIA